MTPMFETHDEPVDVLTAFLDGRIRPLRFRWKGRVVRVRKVTGEWSRREGSYRLAYFSVEGPGAESYELCYDPRGPSWRLCKAWST
jgi:hypothetical protein